MITTAPYLPCPRCNQMPPDCIEAPIDEVLWEVQLRRSMSDREEQRSAAALLRRRTRKAAA